MDLQPYRQDTDYDKSGSRDDLRPADSPLPAGELHPALKDRYTLVRKLGTGTQGSVFLAQPAPGTSCVYSRVAIKIYDIRSFENIKAMELLDREIDTIRDLHHPGIPEFVDVLRDDSYVYLVEQYIEAPSLMKLIEQKKHISWEHVIDILTGAAKILAYLQDGPSPVIHRDIKPDNILVSFDNNPPRVWLVDFGTVTKGSLKTPSSTFAGTAGYAAPEQSSGRALPASDIYGVGASILHLITHIPPFEMGMNGLAINYEPNLPANTPERLRTLLAGMLIPDPDYRYKNASELLNAIQGKAEGSVKKFSYKQQAIEVAALVLLSIITIAIFRKVSILFVLAYFLIYMGVIVYRSLKHK